MFTTGTENQIAFATKIVDGLVKRMVETKMLPAEKVDALISGLKTNASLDAGVWIDTAKSLGHTALLDNGFIAADPRAFLGAVTKAR